MDDHTNKRKMNEEKLMNGWMDDGLDRLVGPMFASEWSHDDLSPATYESRDEIFLIIPECEKQSEESSFWMRSTRMWKSRRAHGCIWESVTGTRSLQRGARL